MRLFRRARDRETSVIRREAVSAVTEAVTEPTRVLASFPVSGQAGQAEHAGEASERSEPSEPKVAAAYEDVEDSDVFLCESSVERAPRRTPQPIREVTLFVHGWHNVEPGLLSWTFPSLRSALDAVQRMRNAIGWCVVSGTDWQDLESARAQGAVLVEQLHS